MLIASDRRDLVAVPPDELWAAMARVEDYRRWWPWLRRFRAEALAAGDRWEAVVQPPVPYRLRFDIDLVEVTPLERVVAEVRGDIEGTAELRLQAVTGGSELHLRSALAPTSTAPRVVASLLPAIARFGHAWVLDTGLRQFRDRALGG